MLLHVQRQMIRTRETLLAMVTFEGLTARVLPEVPGELVRARKAPSAIRPSADVGLFAYGSSGSSGVGDEFGNWKICRLVH